MFNRTKTQEEIQAARGQDTEYVPLKRCKGKRLIIRPLAYERDFKTKHSPEGTDVIIADVAVLDPINETVDEYDNRLPGFPAGSQFRNQAILAGYLKGTFKHHIGDTLIGTIYFGTNEKGKPPLLWQDLSGNPEVVAYGQRFLAARPEFLVLVPREQVAPAQASQAAPGWASGAGGYGGQQQADPWAQNPSAPVSPAQGGPWATAPVPQSAPPMPQSAPPSAQPPMTTLDQLKAFQVNHHGQPQSSEAPF